MKKTIYILFLIINFGCYTYSQKARFEWQIHQSLSCDPYCVKIIGRENRHTIQIYKFQTRKTTTSQINKTDYDSLIMFLTNYSFKVKDNDITLGKGKEYQKVKILNDSNWIILNGDSIQLEKAKESGLIFDNDSNKYYYEVIHKVLITDGTDYEGKFEKNNQIKKYKIHSGRISEEDYKLNLLIANLIRKYFPNQNYTRILRDIEMDKPVRKEYQ